MVHHQLQLLQDRGKACPPLCAVLTVALLSVAAEQEEYKILSPQMHSAPTTAFLQSARLASADYFGLIISLDYHIVK